MILSRRWLRLIRNAIGISSNLNSVATALKFFHINSDYVGRTSFIFLVLCIIICVMTNKHADCASSHE